MTGWPSCRKTPPGGRGRCSTSTSPVITVRGLEPAIRPAGPAWSRTSLPAAGCPGWPECWARQMRFGLQTCGTLEESARREWLIADGVGEYACGTVAGLRTRAYHGLLM